MRKLTGFQVSPVNEKLEIEVVDEPGSGGANHRYDITGFDTATNDSASRPNGYKSSFSRTIILFQNGTLPDKGVNGITSEALLAILIDRHTGFANGGFASRENAIALTHLQDALNWLQHRTRERLARGVEGKYEK